MAENELRASEAAAIIDAVETMQEGQIHEIEAHGDKAIVIDLPKGRELRDLRPYVEALRKLPERKTGSRTMTTLESFVDYVNRHKTDHSVVFLDDRQPAQPKLAAIFNAHNGHASGGSPDWEDFGATYAFPMSDEWRTWRSEKTNVGQEAFAELIEQNIRDLIDPSEVPEEVKRTATEAKIVLAGPQKMLTLSKGLTVHIDTKWTHKVNLQSGGGQIFWQQDESDEFGAPLDVPGGFCIAIPVFKLGPLYPIAVRLRYRKASQTSIAWTLTLFDVDQVLETAVAGAAAKVAAETGLPVFRGG